MNLELIAQSCDVDSKVIVVSNVTVLCCTLLYSSCVVHLEIHIVNVGRSNDMHYTGKVSMRVQPNTFY